MKAHVVNLYVLLPADIQSEGERADAVSAAMSENLMMSGAILDWEYADQVERVVEIGDEYQPDEHSIAFMLGQEAIVTKKGDAV